MERGRGGQGGRGDREEQHRASWELICSALIQNKEALFGGCGNGLVFPSQDRVQLSPPKLSALLVSQAGTGSASWRDLFCKTLQ